MIQIKGKTPDLPTGIKKPSATQHHETGKALTSADPRLAAGREHTDPAHHRSGTFPASTAEKHNRELLVSCFLVPALKRRVESHENTDDRETRSVGRIPAGSQQMDGKCAPIGAPASEQRKDGEATTQAGARQRPRNRISCVL